MVDEGVRYSVPPTTFQLDPLAPPEGQLERQSAERQRTLVETAVDDA